MKSRVFYLALVIQMDGDLRVSLDAGDRIDDDVLRFVINLLGSKPSLGTQLRFPAF